MKLGVSNLCWKDKDDLMFIINCLLENNINFVEVVIGRYINWESLNTSRFEKLVSLLNKANIQITSTQSITYGSKIQSISSSDFFVHLDKVIRICDEFGIQNIVLGAPKLRNGRLIDFLGNLKKIDNNLQNRKINILLEPNARRYGGCYFYTIKEIVDCIKDYIFSNIKTMIDTHNILLEKQDIVEEFEKNQDLIKHIHISEIDLVGFKSSEKHQMFSDHLKNNEYNGLIIYEALPSNSFLKDIKQFSKIYNIRKN